METGREVAISYTISKDVAYLSSARWNPVPSDGVATSAGHPWAVAPRAARDSKQMIRSNSCRS